MQNLSDTSGPPVVAATVHWSLLRSGSVTEVCQITQEMDWKSVAGSLKEWWMPMWEFWFKWSSICTEEIRRDTEHLQLSVKHSIPEGNLKTLQESLPMIQAVLKNKGTHTKYWLVSIWYESNSVFALYIIYPCMFRPFNKSLNLFPFFLAKYKEINVGSSLKWNCVIVWSHFK